LFSDEAPNLKTEDMIMCCLFRAIEHLGAGAVIDGYGAMEE
jgi:hypothetical protein